MTQRTLFKTDFSRAGRRKIAATFDGGTITSNAGLLLLREANKRCKLTRKLAACLDDRRQPKKIQHPAEQMLAQRIFAIAAGYEDLNDHDTLRGDPVLQLAAAAPAKLLASPPTLSRFECAVTHRALLRMQRVFVEHFVDAHEDAPEEIILDFDASDTVIHGKQEKRHFNGYYDHHCYLPLFVTCDDFLLLAWLRPSNIDAPKGSLLALKPLVSYIRGRWPNTRIIVRADSGFCRDRLLDWCERNDVGYIIGLARNKRLVEAGENLMQEAREQCKDGVRKGRTIGEFRYQTKESWSRERRVIARAEYHLGALRPENPRFVVTTLAGDPRELYERVYCARGDMENRVKEVQRQLFADRASSHHFLANQLRVTLAAAAYVLMDDVRRIGCKGTEFAACEAATLRTKLIKVGARITLSARRLIAHCSSSFPYPDVFARIARNLMGRAMPAGP